MCCNPENGRWTFVDGFSAPGFINALKRDKLTRSEFNGRGNPMCWHGLVVNSNGRVIWNLYGGVYQVHRTLFTGHLGDSAMFTDLSLQVAPVSGLVNQGRCKVYRSLFTDAPKNVPSLPISLYRYLYSYMQMQSISLSQLEIKNEKVRSKSLSKTHLNN